MHAALGLRVYETDTKIDTVSKSLQKQQNETDECCKRTTRGLLTNVQELQSAKMDLMDSFKFLSS